MLTEQDQRDLQSRNGRCEGDEQQLVIDITTDQYGFENKWQLIKSTNQGVQEVESGPPKNRNYGKKQRYFGAYCLSPGQYKFIITDLFKDGMCCSFGEGKYTGKLAGKEIFSSPSDDANWKKRTHPFRVKTASSGGGNNNNVPISPKIDNNGNGNNANGMDARDREWLKSHNDRRKIW